MEPAIAMITQHHLVLRRVTYGLGYRKRTSSPGFPHCRQRLHSLHSHWYVFMASARVGVSCRQLGCPAVTVSLRREDLRTGVAAAIANDNLFGRSPWTRLAVPMAFIVRLGVKIRLKYHRPHSGSRIIVCWVVRRTELGAYRKAARGKGGRRTTAHDWNLDVSLRFYHHRLNLFEAALVHAIRLDAIL
jgi:hypothetical protein